MDDHDLVSGYHRDRFLAIERSRDEAEDEIVAAMRASSIHARCPALLDDHYGRTLSRMLSVSNKWPFNSFTLDTLSGGQGNDTMTAGTSAVTDVFKWHLGDAGTEGVATHATDTIIGFDANKASAGGDILDLRDLLVGENAGSTGAASLTHYLDFDTTTTAGSTIIHISSHGDFANGYAAANEDQQIVLQGVDLRATMGLAANATDATVISELINRGKLITDGQ